jgi:hypothetical protein
MVQTSFSVADETDLTTALGSISLPSGINAAPNTAYTITLTAAISLTAAASLDLDTGSSLTLEGDALFATGQTFTVIGSITTDLNFTGTITLDGGSVDNVAVTSGPPATGSFTGQIVDTSGAGDGVVNAGNITYSGIGGAVDFTGGTNTTDNTGTIDATSAAGVGVFFAAGTVDNGTTTDTTSLITGGTFGVEITGAGLVSNDGTISVSGALGTAVYLGSGTIDNGTVLDTTALITSPYFGIEVAGAGFVANDGTITGTVGDGVYLGSGTVDNGAAGDTTALVDSDTGNGVQVQDGPGIVDNFGTISATDDVGVYLASGGTLTNEGTAADVTGAFDGVVIGQPGSSFAGTIDNYGTITANGDTSVNTVIGVFLENGGTVVNGLAAGSTATIQGNSDGVLIDGGAVGAGALVQNEGTISGNIGVNFLGDGTDEAAGTIVNDGLIESLAGVSPYAVVFGDGNGRLVLDSGGSFVGAVLGSSAEGGTTTLELATGTTGTLSGLATNAGTVTDTAGTFDFSLIGTIDIDSGASWTISNPGTFATVYDAGALTIASGAGVGFVQLQSGGAVTLQGSATSGQTVQYVVGATATLALAAPNSGAPSAVQAVIEDFGLDGTIDLQNIANSLVTGFSYSGSMLDVLDNATTLAVLDLPGPFASNSFMHMADNASGTFITTDVTPCLTTGTAIRTASGDVLVQDLRVGDHVVCVGGPARPVRWIGRRRVDVARHPSPASVAPVRVCRDAFADGLPRRDLLLSPDHAVYVDGVLIPIKHLVNDGSIAQVEADEIEYWHVELDRHDVMLAEGLPVESFLDIGNRAAFSNHDGPVMIHPDFARSGDGISLIWEALGYARLVIDGDEIQRVRHHLTLRAENRQRAFSADPDVAFWLRLPVVDSPVSGRDALAALPRAVA